jgi:lambda family phage tail tape measure protein
LQPDTERLVVALEARVRDFERNFQRANRTANDNFGRIERRGAQSARRLESTMAKASAGMNRALSTIGANFAGGLAAGIGAGGAAGLVQSIRSTTKAIAEMRGEAERAGLGVEGFQELSYAARQTGVGVDALVDGIKELQLRADEFILTGAGGGAEAFQRLGYTADTLSAKLTNPSALFTEIIGKLGTLDRAAQIRIADEIFGGTGGEQFVRFLRDGEDGIRRNIDEARRLGIVMDGEMVDKAVAVDRAFNKIADTLEARLKFAVVAIATGIGSWATKAEEFIRKFENSTFLQRMTEALSDGALSNPSAPQANPRPQDQILRQALDKAGANARAAVPDRKAWLPGTFDPGNKLNGLQTQFRSSLEGFIAAANEAGHKISVTSGFRSVERQQQLWTQAVAKYGSEAEARKWVAPPGRSNHNRGQAADLGYGNSAARTWAHANANRFGMSFPLSNENWHIEPAGLRGNHAMGDPDTSAASARDAGATAAERQANAIKAVADQLEFERQQLGRTAEQQRVYQALQQAGVDLNSKEGQAIAGKARALHQAELASENLKTAQDKARQAQEQFASIGRDMLGGFIGDLRNGASLTDALTNAIGRLADRLIDLALDKIFEIPAAGATGGGGLFGGLFGGLAKLFGLGFAEGGYTGHGGKFQPAGIVHRGEYVMSKAATSRIGVGNLENLHQRALRGYSSGGLVGKMPNLATSGTSGTSQPITISAPITVNGSAGTPEQNDDLAKRMARELDATMRGVVADEMRRQARPGNLMNSRSWGTR